MKICFAVASIEFDVATPLVQPLGGTESCVCYLAQALAMRGHSVHLLSHNKNPGVRAGCVCLNILDHLSSAFFAAQQFDAVILVNLLEHVPILRTSILPPETAMLLWCHHDSDQAIVSALADAAVRQQLNATVFVSNYQRQRAQQTFGMVGRESTVIHNGLTPAFSNLFESPASLLAAKRDNDIAVYTSTPFRGLDILFEIMSNAPPGVLLRSFAGMSVYQASDAPYAPLFARGAQLDNVDLVGPVSQPRLAQEMKNSSLFIYPNSFAETFCIAAIEGLACGLDLIVTDRGALPEVCGDFATYVPAEVMDKDLPLAIQLFREALAVQTARKRADVDQWAEAKFKQAMSVSAQYSWEGRATEWETLLRGFSGQHRPRLA
ncbi:glycosyltransferase family 4 protein [Caballeronia sp. LjRoot34]|uniref:glycosyltransferase family 4 protein n=1 Tax=Caballeronia sp. LjRoot34 TaxID=3342325 RepID=UPI003ECF30AF